jgi:lipopolysaccharide biosynthesis glycosyltransferase
LWQNENDTLWDATSVLPVGLMTFYSNTRPLDKSWHVMGLRLSATTRTSGPTTAGAVVVHFNGNLKPWLDIAFNQYKQLKEPRLRTVGGDSVWGN